MNASSSCDIANRRGKYCLPVPCHFRSLHKLQFRHKILLNLIRLVTHLPSPSSFSAVVSQRIPAASIVTLIRDILFNQLFCNAVWIQLARIANIKRVKKNRLWLYMNLLWCNEDNVSFESSIDLEVPRSLSTYNGRNQISCTRKARFVYSNQSKQWNRPVSSCCSHCGARKLGVGGCRSFLWLSYSY